MVEEEEESSDTSSGPSLTREKFSSPSVRIKSHWEGLK